MPIYAYRCAACGHAQDVLQKMSDPLLTVCPACGAAALQKQVTAAGFQLKGSGWYVTDFRGDGKAPKKSADGAPTPDAPAAKGDAAAKPAEAAAPAASGGDKAGAAPAAPAPAPSPAPAAASSSSGSDGKS